MKIFLPLFWFTVFGVGGQASAGTIVGIVRAQVTTGSEVQGMGDNYKSRRYKFADRIDYERLQNFVVYIDQPVTIPGAPPSTATVVQKDAMFEPHVLPIAVGTTVKWPNGDDIFHNVFSMSEAKEFNLGLYKDKVPMITFDKPGRVDVFCGIHSRMHCIILVLPSAFFSKVDAGRSFLIKDVPAGTYKVKAWHERLPAQVKEITVPAEGEVSVDFVLGLSGQTGT